MREHTRTDTGAGGDENIPLPNRSPYLLEFFDSESSTTTTNHSTTSSLNGSTSNLSSSSSSQLNSGETLNLFATAPAIRTTIEDQQSVKGVPLRFVSCEQGGADSPYVFVPGANPSGISLNLSGEQQRDIEYEDILCSCGRSHGRYICPKRYPPETQSKAYMRTLARGHDENGNESDCTADENVLMQNTFPNHGLTGNEKTTTRASNNSSNSGSISKLRDCTSFQRNVQENSNLPILADNLHTLVHIQQITDFSTLVHPSAYPNGASANLSVTQQINIPLEFEEILCSCGEIHGRYLCPVKYSSEIRRKNYLSCIAQKSNENTRSCTEDEISRGSTSSGEIPEVNQEEDVNSVLQRLRESSSSFQSSALQETTENQNSHDSPSHSEGEIPDKNHEWVVNCVLRRLPVKAPSDQSSALQKVNEGQNSRSSASHSGMAIPNASQEWVVNSVLRRLRDKASSSQPSSLQRNAANNASAESISNFSVIPSSENERTSVASADTSSVASDNWSIEATDNSSFASGRASPSNCSVDSLETCGVASLHIQSEASGDNYSESGMESSSVASFDNSNAASAPNSSVPSTEHYCSTSGEKPEPCRNPEEPVSGCSQNLVQRRNHIIISSREEDTLLPGGNSDETSYFSTSFEESVLVSPENSNELPAEDTSNVDVRRTKRITKRKREFFEFCPICGITVRLPELQAHFAKEVESLARIHRKAKKPRREEDIGSNRHYVQVKNNRENRLTAKVAQYATRARSEVQCPACSLRISGTVQDINKHVLYCLSQEENSDDCLVVDDDDNENFEEYEFGNETRVRAVSFVPGGYNSLQGHTRKRHTSEEDEDLNVDVDDTIAYGQAQYSELDVIPGAMDDKEQEELLQLRRAVLQNSDAQPHVLESRKWSVSEDVTRTDEAARDSEEPMPAEMNAREVSPEEKEKNSNPSLVMSSLKEKIRDLEQQNKSVKCLICLEPYTKPVVSTACWHVYCEECWLMTMGVKKLCPQCNTIVSPSDLRRIYL